MLLLAICRTADFFNRDRVLFQLLKEHLRQRGGFDK